MDFLFHSDKLCESKSKRATIAPIKIFHDNSSFRFITYLSLKMKSLQLNSAFKWIQKSDVTLAILTEAFHGYLYTWNRNVQWVVRQQNWLNRDNLSILVDFAKIDVPVCCICSFSILKHFSFFFFFFFYFSCTRSDYFTLGSKSYRH
jgi:hypothetical protein